ncbi:hypothetical protein F4808DRAFT_468514 [Astrocystis sublimbata]|nr:hypothetical protein F4808DRAFT_468514 [Astrocystis sublimbata]
MAANTPGPVGSFLSLPIRCKDSQSSEQKGPVSKGPVSQNSVQSPSLTSSRSTSTSTSQKAPPLQNAETHAGQQYGGPRSNNAIGQHPSSGNRSNYSHREGNPTHVKPEQPWFDGGFHHFDDFLFDDLPARPSAYPTGPPGFFHSTHNIFEAATSRPPLRTVWDQGPTNQREVPPSSKSVQPHDRGIHPIVYRRNPPTDPVRPISRRRDQRSTDPVQPISRRRDQRPTNPSQFDDRENPYTRRRLNQPSTYPAHLSITPQQWHSGEMEEQFSNHPDYWPGAVKDSRNKNAIERPWLAEATGEERALQQQLSLLEFHERLMREKLSLPSPESIQAARQERALQRKLGLLGIEMRQQHERELRRAFASGHDRGGETQENDEHEEAEDEDVSPPGNDGPALTPSRYLPSKPSLEEQDLTKHTKHNQDSDDSECSEDSEDDNDSECSDDSEDPKRLFTELEKCLAQDFGTASQRHERNREAPQPTIENVVPPGSDGPAATHRSLSFPSTQQQGQITKDVTVQVTNSTSTHFPKMEAGQLGGPSAGSYIHGTVTKDSEDNSDTNNMDNEDDNNNNCPGKTTPLVHGAELTGDMAPPLRDITNSLDTNDKKNNKENKDILTITDTDDKGNTRVFRAIDLWGTARAKDPARAAAFEAFFRDAIHDFYMRKGKGSSQPEDDSIPIYSLTPLEDNQDDWLMTDEF